MVRLMLVLAPVMCILGGIAVSALLHKFMKELAEGSGDSNQNKKSGDKIRNKGSNTNSTGGRSEVNTLTIIKLKCNHIVSRITVASCHYCVDDTEVN